MPVIRFRNRRSSYWRSHSHAERYRQIEIEELPRRYARIAERRESIGDQAADLEEQLIAQLRIQASELPARVVPNALRNASTTKAINIDKASLVRGRRTEITATADVTELLKTMASRFGEAVEVDSALLTENPGGSLAR